MIKAAIAGATGYTGSELLRILLHHPKTEVVRITSEQHAGTPIESVFPQFRDLINLTYEPLNPEILTQDVDVVFMALPHTMAMKTVARIADHGIPMIDLSGDFRLDDPSLYPTWYHVEHSTPSLLQESVYGLTELNRDAIKSAKLLANPGCYPTCALLGLAPLLHNKIIDANTIIIDAKSGVTGAGKTPKPNLHFPEANESLMAYRIGDHQHTPEIEQELSRIAGKTIQVNFTPHLIPMNRGILCTTYAKLIQKQKTETLLKQVKDFYADEPFVQILPPGIYPSTRDVRGSNRCDIALKADARTGTVIVVSVIDNLVKGAAGQAIQNMNLMLGLEETTGLDLTPLTP